MRRIDDELAAAGAPRVFFHSPIAPSRTAETGGRSSSSSTRTTPTSSPGGGHFPPCPGLWLLDRVDVARARFGAAPALGQLPARTREHVACRLAKEARALLDEKHENYPTTLTGKTILIEFARGGPDGSKFPLVEPLGYQGSIPCLSPAILERAAILYIWVTPEESRRKNVARTDPNDPGSILHHGVPHEVMMKDYGCDDMEHLLSTSPKPGHVRLAAFGREFLLPVARLDNRVDKTSFIREPREKWDPKNVKALHEGLRSAFAGLRSSR